MDSPEYEIKLKRITEEGEKILSFKSADGIKAKKKFRHSELALADYIEPKREEKVLVAQSGKGVLGVIFGSHSSKTVLAETSDRAYQISKVNLEENGIDASCRKVGHYDEIEQSFGKIVYAPESYEPVDFVKYRLGNLIQLLEDEGNLYIAGKKHDGINRYKDYLDSLEGNLEKVAQEGSQKIYRYIKEGETEPEKPEIEISYNTELEDVKLYFTACKGLFSPHNLDKGSKLLMENIEPSGDDKVLDLACGYGVIGIYLKKKFDSNIYLTDDNAIAAYYAKKNLENNNIEKYQIENRDCLNGFKDKKFDVIVSNPPTHQGEGVTDEMFKQCYNLLKGGGTLYLVYNQNMNYKPKLEQIGFSTKILDEENNFRVLEARR